MNKKIKLLICYHKKAPLFKDGILTPIHVGRANAKKRLDTNSENFKWLMTNLIGDDTGDNISALNDSYNEMTALYWAWKNYDKLGDPDYIGLMHYRRHFVLNPGVQDVYNIKNFDSSTYYDILNYSEKKMQEIVEDCDFITHIGRVNNVYKHYIENQRKEDIDLASEILLKKYPEYSETLHEYYGGDLSNFCNMNIFSKELFNKYCEFVFSILEEFDNQVDTTEKRFFISERLTGVFIAHLMKDKTLKHKILPIAFLDEAVEVPIAMKIAEDDNLVVSTTITSILSNAKGYNKFHLYLFHGNEVSDETKEKFAYFERKHLDCTIDFILCDKDEDFLPLYVSQKLPKVNKCIYLSGHVISMFDIGEFYRICSTDDYYVVGVPENNYAPEEKDKKIRLELLVLNCKRIRAHDIASKAELVISAKTDGKALLNELCKGEIGYIPWYLFTSEKTSPYGLKLISDEQRRGIIQNEATWRPFLVYDNSDPVLNSQGVYSIFWWKAMKKIPLRFQKLDINLKCLEVMYAEQQREINKVKEDSSVHMDNNFVKQSIEVDTKDSHPTEEWRSYNLWGKILFFYKHNGLKKTISYCLKKINGEKDNSV